MQRSIGRGSQIGRRTGGWNQNPLPATPPKPLTAWIPGYARLLAAQAEGKHIEERTDRNRGFLSKLGKKSRSKLLCYNRVSVAPGVCALYVGVVLVNGEVIRRCPPQRNVAFEVY